MKKCKKCWSENITGYEFMGAYDWVLHEQCEDCGYMEHRNTGYEVERFMQVKEYWPVIYRLKHKWKQYTAENRHLLNPK